jgi:cytosine/adenosine deaminase-related metal-dependent hydrolase
MASVLSFRARWILPIDRPPIEGGYVTIAGGRIVELGSSPPKSAALVDLGDVLLMPGLVNVHTHLEFSGLSAPLGQPGMSLPAWIRFVIAERNRGNRDAASDIATGLNESLAAGVTTIGEIASSSAAAYASPAPTPAAVAFQEAIGFSAQRVDSVYADVERRLDELRGPAGLSPHAPYTVHPRLLERLVDLARRRNVPLAMHLAESPEELELLATGAGQFRDLLEERSMWDAGAVPPGSRPLDYLQQLAAAPSSLVIHGNYLADDEIDFVAQRRGRMSVAYCPRTHAFFQHSPYPLSAMLRAGVRVALGTDSRASNPDLSLLGEVRFAAAQFPGVPPHVWLRMATLDGAEALGLAEHLGSLTPGKQANLVSLPCPGGDPAEAVVNSRTMPAAVWLAGVRV